MIRWTEDLPGRFTGHSAYNASHYVVERWPGEDDYHVSFHLHGDTLPEHPLYARAVTLDAAKKLAADHDFRETAVRNYENMKRLTGEL